MVGRLAAAKFFHHCGLFFAVGIAHGNPATSRAGFRRTAFDRPRSASRCGIGEGTGWTARLPHKGPKTRKAAKERPWVREGNSPLLSQKSAIHQRPRAGTDKGELRAARLLSRSLNAKKPPEASGGRTSSDCIYDAILQSIGGDVNGKVASGRVPRRTRCSANNRFGRRN